MSPTPGAVSPTPGYVSPTPGAYFPTPAAAKPTPNYVSPTPGAYFPTPAGPRPTPHYVSPTPPFKTPNPTPRVQVVHTTYVGRPVPTPALTRCYAHGQPGVCLSTSSCTLTSYPASSGVTDDGCRHIPDATVQCCAPAAPANGGGISGPVPTSGTITECQVAQLLRLHGVAEAWVPKLVCTAKYESTYRCGVTGPPNRDGTRDYGLFQVNSRYWCSGGAGRNSGNGCGITCQEALDCSKAARCAKEVLREQGITAWYGYTSHRSECDRYRLPASCRSGGTIEQQPAEVAREPDRGQISIGQPARVPSGRSCALARPSGCSAFNGRTLTVNAKFSDEVVRIHSHAQNARIRVYITDSFRRIGASNYGASRSRHKVGFALDMNANGCNSACMCRLNSISNAGAKRFLISVVADSTLHWGADPSAPINWPIYSGGVLRCSKDSVHIQSRTYEDGGSNYDSMRTCLSNEYSASRFQRFSCSSGVALLNDDVRAEVEAEMNGDGSDDGGLATGTIVVIVVAPLCCLVLLALLVAGLVMFVFAARTEEPTFDERGAIGFQNEVYMTNASENDQYSSAVYDQAPAAKNTYAQGNYATGSAAGQPDFYSAQAFGGNDVAAYSAQPLNYQGGAGGDFKCELCGKAYSFAEDLQHHIEKRHA